MALFITFEGPEGAGKTTQIRQLETELQALGHDVVRTREPGGDRVGEKVRELLLHGDMGAEAELLLFAAARAQNVREVVRPALASGKVVLCDRFTDSTIAYQGYARNLPLDLIRQVNTFATGGLIPHRTFLLDLPPAVGLSRQDPDKQNRLDREDLTFHERVRQGFLDVAAAEPERIRVVDASQPAEVVAAELKAAILALLDGAG